MYNAVVKSPYVLGGWYQILARIPRIPHQLRLISPEYQAHAGDKRVDRKLARPYHLGIVGLSEKD
ncbi:MAG TPA: hypothetical protein VMV76_00235 [Dehalococcoidia bacterium]|nr:hypothetical protein [Dehalococcoidia bacterium]